MDAFVTDRAGNPVTNLRLDEFEILEDGRRVRDRRARTAKGTETFSVAVPLDVDAGAYVLHVEATSGDATVSRDIPITVR